MIEFYVNEILDVLAHRRYFTALALTLALPDMCGAVEFPQESVGRRYIDWCDKYLEGYKHGDEKTPDINGEVIYNLRNTFLHTGSPNVAGPPNVDRKSCKQPKNKVNRLDKFVLILGDGTRFHTASLLIELPPDPPIIEIRGMVIDVTYLCKVICDCSLRYYQKYKDNFVFDFKVKTQEELFSPDKKEGPKEDRLIELINQKLESNRISIRVDGFVGSTLHESVNNSFSQILENPDLKRRFDNGEPIDVVEKTPAPPYSIYYPKKKNVANTLKEAPKTDSKKKQSDKREAQVRSFFGKHFKAEKYKQKKEQIIQAVLTSKTKQQVNRALQKIFPNGEVSVIYKRLAPLLESLPGQ